MGSNSGLQYEPIHGRNRTTLRTHWRQEPGLLLGGRTRRRSEHNAVAAKYGRQGRRANCCRPAREVALGVRRSDLPGVAGCLAAVEGFEE